MKPPEGIRHMQPAHTETKQRRKDIAESLDEHGYEDLPQTNLRKMKEYESGIYHSLMVPREHD